MKGNEKRGEEVGSEIKAKERSNSTVGRGRRGGDGKLSPEKK